MSKTILTVGFDLAGDASEYMNFSSKASLLDWDIVLFRPDIVSFMNYGIDKFQGKESLSETKSFELRSACEHWKREIKEVFESGGMVIAFLSKPQEVFIDTGERTFSGTGRNRKTTQHVTEYSNYEALPISNNWIVTQGASMRLLSSCAGILSSYWKEFEAYSSYHVVFPENSPNACIATKRGQKPVSLLFQDKNSNGILLLLPDIYFGDDDFYEEIEGKICYSRKGQEFSAKMISAIVALDETVRSNSGNTPAPSWSSADCYALTMELKLKSELLAADKNLEKAQEKREEIASNLAGMGYLRDLLYENGKPLEKAILGALRIIGFTAEQFQDHQSEFDAVFESPEGRFIGEAEGKDNKAISVEKLRQLAMNIQEDLERDDVDAPAKGILFGNGYRFEEPGKRKEQFTPKCISAAKVSSTGLLPTIELFAVAKYLHDHPNDAFAEKCRLALIKGSGVIKMPSPPAIKKTTE